MYYTIIRINIVLIYIAYYVFVHPDWGVGVGTGMLVLQLLLSYFSAN